VPPALAGLQSTIRFPSTFIPYYQAKDNWQRFNLASLSDWLAWRNAATIDASYYNSVYPDNESSAREFYVPRQVLTTVNNSDELARIDKSKDAGWTGLGLRQGALKFYLGRIRNAFDVNNRFVSNPVWPGDDGYDVVHDLANYFYEMLASYDDWADPTDPNATEAVSRRQQAYMLAVNTVAFAAPRDTTTGHVDMIHAYDPNDPDGPRTYYGYAPQPFITQVVAYNDPVKLSDPNSPADPNDPTMPTRRLRWRSSSTIRTRTNWGSATWIRRGLPSACATE